VTRVLVLSGTGRYADRWHDFAATSQRVAAAVEPLASSVTVLATEPDSLLRLAEADLLVVNSGTAAAPAAEPSGPLGAGPGTDPGAGPGTDPGAGAANWAAAHAALTDYLDSARPLLALHTAANTFNDVPAWHRRLGVRWISGHSMHPPIGAARVHVEDSGHPVTAGLADFTVHDERYTHLVVSDHAVRLTHHVHDGARHPLLLVHDRGGRRTVYDALGHDVRSYDTAARTRLLREAAAWALGGRPGPR
jgi:hypothetical protein